MKRFLVIFFAAVTALMLMTASAFASESLASGRSEGGDAASAGAKAQESAAQDTMPIEIASEHVVAEITSASLENLQGAILDNGASDLEGSQITYINSFGVIVSGSSGDPKKYIGSDSSWHVLNTDLNAGAGGDYVYLAYHTTCGFPVPDNNAKPITGLLIVMDVPDPLKNPKDVVWEGKTYHPVLANWHDGPQGASVDLNSGTGDYPKYLYYSHDGWDTGAPMLTGAAITKDYDAHNVERKLDYAYLHKPGDPFERSPWSVFCSPADLRGPVSSGAPIYLMGTYHKHSAEFDFDDKEHWVTCAKCDYKARTPHAEIVTNVGGYHRTSCSGCKYTRDDPHVDTDGDNVCDVCQCCFAVTADGLSFASFPDAWAYAVDAHHPVTIRLLETLDANKDGSGNAVNLKNSMSPEADITIENAPGAKLIVSQQMPFLIWNGTVKIDGEVESVCEDSIQIFATLTGKIILGKNADIALTKATSVGSKILSGVSNAPVMAAGAGSVETCGGSISFSNRIEGSAGISVTHASAKTSLVAGNTTIAGADVAILIEGDVDAMISGGFYDAGNGCALKVRSFASGSNAYHPEVKITGGEFVGATCIDIDANSALSIEEGIFKGVFTGKNVTECMAEGTSAAEIDAAGTITKRIERQTLKDAGDSFDFKERTRIALTLESPAVADSDSENGSAGGNGGNNAGGDSEGVKGIAKTGDGNASLIAGSLLLAVAAGLVLFAARKQVVRHMCSKRR